MDSQGNPIIKTDSQGKPVNEVDGRGNSILLDAQGHVLGRDAQGNPILLDGSGNVVPTKNVVIVPNGTSIDANGNSVNAYNLEFTLTDGTKQDESATGGDSVYFGTWFFEHCRWKRSIEPQSGLEPDHRRLERGCRAKHPFAGSPQSQRNL